jgi:hypothetical protein
MYSQGLTTFRLLGIRVEILTSGISPTGQRPGFPTTPLLDSAAPPATQSIARALTRL